jgi:hypothetical protein
MDSGTSRLRQRLAQAGEQQRQQLELLLSESGPLIRGSFGTRVRVCGDPSCRCTRGEVHQSKYLSASDGGQVRQVHVPASEEVDVAAGVERYRRFFEGRRRVAQLVRQQLELLDELGRSLLKPYPPEAPLPPPGRRGRKPRGRRAPPR